MALGSQKSQAETLAGLTNLAHDIFVGDVMDNVRRESPVSMMFQDATPGDYKLIGENMRFAVDLQFKTGALATDGFLPDHVGLDAVQGFITPIRRYERIALDNFVEKRVSGEGAFDDLSDRIFTKLWDAWASMEIRHSTGASDGVICKVTSRTNATSFVVKDGYGLAGTYPLSNLSENSILAWYDVANSRIGGSAAITSTGINYNTKTITIDSEQNWETDVGQILRANDLIFFATTDRTTTDYFVSERNLAPNGMGTILDPTASSTTVHDISQTTYGRWKPYRVASTTFDHLELTEHWLALGSKRGFKVSPQIDTVIAYPSVVAQMARSLMGLQQQAYSGSALQGGYQTVTVAGIPFVEDHFWYHNVCATICEAYLYRINLGGDADFWGEDGSMWARIADFDGKSAFVGEYMQTFCNHRGANGALTGITTDLTDDNFAPAPNY